MHKYPDIVVVGTVGPSPDGEDFAKGWSFANELRVPMVDELYYKFPQWFRDNLDRYDNYNRNAADRDDRRHHGFRNHSPTTITSH